jgi:REP element-mobilizing transposase RayT
LKFPRITLTPEQYPVVAETLGEVIGAQKYTCWACVIMPDHVHLLIRKHRDRGEVMIRKLQNLSRQLLRRKRLAPAGHPLWTEGGWDAFVDEPRRVWGIIEYINDNPSKLGQPRQAWPFVLPYDNWPLHAGHSAASPYARNLRRLRRYKPNLPARG